MVCRHSHGRGSQLVSTATLTGYTLTILYLTYPLDGILGWLPAFDSASIAVTKIEELGLMIDQPEQEARKRPPTQFHNIAPRGVVHRYESHGQVNFQLGPINMELAAGEVVFISGGNGSGKTTLAKLLTGLYLPENGDVVWDDRVVNDANRCDFRQLFSTIFVEGHLFDRLLGVDVEPGRLEYWLELLEIEDKVDVDTGRLHQDNVVRTAQAVSVAGCGTGRSPDLRV